MLFTFYTMQEIYLILFFLLGLKKLTTGLLLFSVNVPTLRSKGKKNHIFTERSSSSSCSAQVYAILLVHPQIVCECLFNGIDDFFRIQCFVYLFSVEWWMIFCICNEYQNCYVCVCVWLVPSRLQSMQLVWHWPTTPTTKIHEAWFNTVSTLFI